VASLSQGRTAAAQCGLFTYKSVPVIFEPPCISKWRTLLTEMLICLHMTLFLPELVTYIVLNFRTVRRLRFHTPVKIKIMLFWNMMLCRLVNRYLRFCGDEDSIYKASYPAQFFRVRLLQLDY